MDPQATLDAIFEAVKNNDDEQFHQSFEDLAEWLRKGGFRPVLKTMGMTKYNTGQMVTRYVEKPRVSLLCGRYAIMTIDSNSDAGPYQFVIYSPDGMVKQHSFELPM